MRILTPYGFGEGRWPVADTEMAISLEVPYRGGTQITTNKRESVRWGEFGVVRVVSAAGVGIISNLQLHNASAEAEQEVFQRPSPFNETGFLLDFVRGSFQANRVLGPGIQSVFAINPWVDRWCSELTETFQSKEEAVAIFSARTSVVTASGISSSILLDGGKRRIIRAIIFTPAGIVFDKQFD